MAASITARATGAKLASAFKVQASATRGSVRAAMPAKRFGTKLSIAGSKQSSFMGLKAVAEVEASSSKGSRSVTTMKGDVAFGYASALVDLADSSNALEAVHADMDALDGLLKASAEVAEFLVNPLHTAEKKKKVIADIGKEAEFSPLSVNFLNLLVDKSRVNILPEIIETFESMYCDLTDTQVATVTSAVKLENEQQFLIAKKLQEMTGAKNIKLKPVVDESLIAGFVVQYGKDGSAFIDMSVKGQLEKITMELSAESMAM